VNNSTRQGASLPDPAIADMPTDAAPRLPLAAGRRMRSAKSGWMRPVAGTETADALRYFKDR
jgi:hypothetical protein